MLARIAQELFWLGRDVVRAEHTARMLDGAFHADVAGMPSESAIALSWEAVLEIIGAKTPAFEAGPAPDLRAAAAEAAEQPPPLARLEVARLLTTDTDSPASIVSCIARARERGRTLRDVISTEMWSALNSYYLSQSSSDLRGVVAAGPYAAYQEVKERCALFWGLVDRTMLRDEGRCFLEAGGRIEAADMVLRMLRVAVPDEAEVDDGNEGEALALLHAVGGVQAYRRAVRHAPTVGPVARFLLYDGAYPGSVASAVEALHGSLSAADTNPRSSPPVLRLGRLIADLELQRRTPDGSASIAQTLAETQSELELIDHDIDERYFAMAATAALHL